MNVMIVVGDILIWKYHGQAVAYIYDTSSETVLGGFDISFNSVMNGLVRSEAKLNISHLMTMVKI